jgi:hypothetical protein
MSSPNIVQNLTVQTITTTTETAVCTTASRNVGASGPIEQGQLIQALVGVSNVGTLGATMTLRVRAGSGVTGNVIGMPVTTVVTAGSPAAGSINVVDPTQSGTIQYTLTVQFGSATGNSTVNLAQMSEETCNALGV